MAGSRCVCGIVLVYASILGGCSSGSSTGKPLPTSGKDGKESHSVADAWEAVLKNCTDNKTASTGKMVYLGPSNNAGLGTIWGGSPVDGYQLKRLSPEGMPANVLNIPKDWVTCTTSNPKTFKLGGSADLVLTRLKDVSAGLAAELNKAKNVSLRIDAWRQIEIVGDEFTDWINGLPQDNPYKRSLLKQDRVIAYKAIEVKGMIATLEFDSEAAANAHAKLSAVPWVPADVNAKLNSEIKNKKTLEIKAPGSFIIEAQLGVYQPSGNFKGGMSPLDLKKETPVSVDLEN